MIRGVCGPFVTIVNSKIYLIHQTAKEFLVREQERPLKPNHENPGALRWESSLWSVQSNHILTEICVMYLLIAGKTMESSLAMNEAASLKKYADEHVYFKFYSAQYWAGHARKSPPDARKKMIQQLLEICDVDRKGCLSWLH
ncbi:ankyrin repeat domain-containing protein 50 [Colletotrichum tofieldiae]|nr:ankyrin repeat domain-containing protein 50 [Colletotrichum tofieldiae]GKT74967.1 ankyrin repeat domain-containing protein 50 [Colletotrichum tofieldiae]GKT92183.1 ankyrin repeat domain-containing protein 50 [Colletotrichum tofieldiae]